MMEIHYDVNEAGSSKEFQSKLLCLADIPLKRVSKNTIIFRANNKSLGSSLTYGAAVHQAGAVPQTSQSSYSITSAYRNNIDNQIQRRDNSIRLDALLHPTDLHGAAPAVPIESLRARLELCTTIGRQAYYSSSTCKTFREGMTAYNLPLSS